MTFEDLKELGDEESVKKAGKLRQQGKKYVVQDADVIYFKVRWRVCWGGGGKECEIGGVFASFEGLPPPEHIKMSCSPPERDIPTVHPVALRPASHGGPYSCDPYPRAL